MIKIKELTMGLRKNWLNCKSYSKWFTITIKIKVRNVSDPYIKFYWNIVEIA